MNFQSLRTRTILFVLFQALLFAVAIVVTNASIGNNLDTVRDNFRRTIIDKSVLLGKSKEADLAFAASFGQTDQGSKVLTDMVRDSATEVAYAVVLGQSGRPLMASSPEHMSQEFTLNTQEQALSQGEHAVRHVAEQDPISGEPTLRITLPIVDNTTGLSVGALVMGVPLSAVDAKMQAADKVRGQVSIWFIFLLIFVVVANVLGYFIMNRTFISPVRSLRSAAEVVAEGDLSREVDARIRKKRDEMGTLAEAFHRMSSSIRRIVESIQESLSLVLGEAERISGSSHRVAESSQATNESVARTFKSMEEIGLAIGRTAENVDVLAASSEESSSSILEMNAIIDEISENVEQLARAVEETTASISQMNGSIHQVKENVEQLSVAADETASSVTEMDASIKQVEGNAEQTAKLAEGFAQDATVGLEAVNKTIETIQAVHSASKQAAGVMESLGERIDEIGKILNVIDEVAEQTNLLALNAAIIAAQAGEHGKSFAVVADEIKDLAERTAASTAEIATIIKSVQQESSRAIASVFDSTKLVQEGVERSHQAGSILERISSSSRKATDMVREIARATVEQSRGSAQITAAIDKIVNMVLQINVATTEQARGSTLIMGAAQRMKEITILVRGATREQSKGARQINEAMNRVIEMVEYINGAIKEQRSGSSEVLSEMEAIRHSMEDNVDATSAMDRAVAALHAQAEALKREVQRFTL